MSNIDQLLKSLSVIHPSYEDLRLMLESASRPLHIKFGADPSAPDLHLGHYVILRKLKIFQDLGHQVTLVIGDFTARIGDPSGRSQTRPVLSEADIQKNVQTYTEQVGRVLDMNKINVRYNSEWLSCLKMEDIIHLLGQATVAQMLDRDDFCKRFQQEKPISLHEFLYPLLQGYDSIFLKNDIEIGGQDQTFNFYLARTLQKHYGVKPQCIMTYPLLEGLDGGRKMSKSLGNYVALTDSAKEIFAKIMSIPDTLMEQYYRLLTSINPQESFLKETPKEAKEYLGMSIVSQLWGEESAKEAYEAFRKVFSEKQTPDDMPVINANSVVGKSIRDVAVQYAYVQSNKAFMRLYQEGAIAVNHKLLEDPFQQVVQNEEYCVKIGKRIWFKITNVGDNNVSGE